MRKLSELEGAILSEIEHRGQSTAFHVRRAFLDSFSLEWKLSSGSVYPAVRRLEQDGLISASEPTGARKARALSLTESGRQTLRGWATDALLASSIGVDPFRLRAGIWSLLPKDEQRKLFAEVEANIERSITELEAYLANTDPVESVRIELALDVHRGRLRQIAKWREKPIH